MKYRIVWTEVRLKNGIDSIKDYQETLPEGSIAKPCGWSDDHVEFECEDTFEATNDSDAREIVKDAYDAVETFTVFNEQNAIVLTEEDFFEDNV